MRTSRIRIGPTLVSTALLLLGGCQQTSSDQGGAASPKAVRIDAGGGPNDAPGAGKVELKLLDFEGIRQLIASHRGQVVVLDAWSTSCAPCIKEFPNLVALQRKFGPPLACISLSFDFEGIGTPHDKAPAVQAFLESKQATFDNVLSTEESDVLYRKFGFVSVPAVLVYDQTGRLRKRFDNENAQREADAFTYEQVGQLVAELVNEEGTDDDATEAGSAP